MNKFKKLFKIFLLTFLSVFLISCSGGTEIDTLGIVIAIGLDMDGDDIVVTSEVVNPIGVAGKDPNASQEATKFVITRGKTIEEALFDASLTFDKELYLPHAYIIIIGDELAKIGLDGYTDLFTRSLQLRESTLLMVAKDAKAYEVMGIKTGLSSSAGRYIYKTAKQGDVTGRQRPIKISDFFRFLYQKHQGQVFGIIEKIDKLTISKDGKDEITEALSLEGGAVFKEGKLVGYFSGEETNAFRFIVGQYKQGEITFDTPMDLVKEKTEKEHKDKKYSSFKVFKNKTKVDVELIDDKLHLFIDLKLRGNLITTQKSVNLNAPGTISVMEKAIEKKIKEDIETTLKKGQKELEVDTFSIGEVVHRKYPHIWKDIKEEWTEIFKDLEYTVNIDAKINDVGFTNKSTVVKDSRYE